MPNPNPPLVEQIDALLGFLEEHRELALGRCNRSKEGRSLAKRLWCECANILNSVTADCPRREAEGWRLYFNDYKSKTLKMIKKKKQEMSATGGGNYNEIKLSPLQERLYAILGKDIGEPLPGVRHDPTSQNEDIEIPERLSMEVSYSIPFEASESIQLLENEQLELPRSPSPLAGPSCPETPLWPLAELPVELELEQISRAQRRHSAQPAHGPDFTEPPRQRRRLHQERPRRRQQEGTRRRQTEEPSNLERAQQRLAESESLGAAATVRLAESHEKRAEAMEKLAISTEKDAESKMEIARALNRLCDTIAMFKPNIQKSPIIKRRARTPYLSDSD